MQEPQQLKEKTRRNIADVSEIVAEMFKPCLGPTAMAKLVEDKDGLWFSDDPALLLKKVGLQHPVAKAMSDAAASISGSFGDGACSFLVMEAELLRGAVEIISKKTHPNIIVDGWKTALSHCLDSPKLAEADTSDRQVLERVARTVLADCSWNAQKLAPLVVDAVLTLSSLGQLDLNNFSVERVVGGSVEDSFFLRGVAMPHELADPQGPTSVRDAKIALLQGEINEKKPDSVRADTKIEITEVGGISELRNARYRFLEGLAKNVVSTGANVLFVEKGIDPIATEYLSKRGVLVVRRFVIEPFRRLAAATGGTLVTDIRTLSEGDLGHADLVETRNLNGNEWLFVEGCREPKAATFVVRGGDNTLLHSIARAVQRSVKTVKETQLSRKLVYGGGAWEMSLATKVRSLSTRYSGRQQLAMDVFADALESIPLTLAQNAGMDGLSTMADLRARHAAGEYSVGVDPVRRSLAEMGPLGVLDPFVVKRRVLLTAFGVGAMLTRIDNMIVLEQLFGDERTLKKMEKDTEPEKIEARRREYGGMEKLEGPRYRPRLKDIRTTHPYAR